MNQFKPIVEPLCKIQQGVLQTMAENSGGEGSNAEKLQNAWKRMIRESKASLFACPPPTDAMRITANFDDQILKS